MNPRLKSALLWGVVGALAFLVLIQGYVLWSGNGVSVAVKLVVAIVVGASSAVLTYVAEGRYAAQNAAESSGENETS